MGFESPISAPSGRRPTPETARPLGPANMTITKKNVLTSRTCFDLVDLDHLQGILNVWMFLFFVALTCSYGGTLLVAQLVEALRYKSEGRGFDSQRCHWNFSLT
jgi:hypothetical protein